MVKSSMQKTWANAENRELLVKQDRFFKISGATFSIQELRDLAEAIKAAIDETIGGSN